MRRLSGKTIIEVPGGSHLLNLPGVECINPTAEESRRTYRKIFEKKPVYSQAEYDEAVQKHLRGNNTVIIGMNGYSSISPQNCLEWGIKPGAYEHACAQLLRRIIRSQRDQFGGIDIRVAHGASNVKNKEGKAAGIDAAVIGVCQEPEMNIPMLGFSCPRFMMYVEDDTIPVVVSDSQVQYADNFVKSLDILVAANGREQAFRHDINAAMVYNKHVIPINVLHGISDRGGPPAFGPDGRVIDAVAAFENRVHLVSQAVRDINGNQWDAIVSRTQQEVLNICRTIVSPEMAYAD